MSYQSYVAFPKDTQVTIRKVLDALASLIKATGGTAAVQPDRVEVFWEGWSLRVWLTQDPLLLSEMKQPILEASRDPRTAAVAEAETMLEVASDDDPGMDHFNTYVRALEALQKHFPTTAVFEDASRQFL